MPNVRYLQCQGHHPRQNTNDEIIAVDDVDIVIPQDLFYPRIRSGEALKKPEEFCTGTNNFTPHDRDLFDQFDSKSLVLQDLTERPILSQDDERHHPILP